MKIAKCVVHRANQTSPNSYGEGKVRGKRGTSRTPDFCKILWGVQSAWQAWHIAHTGLLQNRMVRAKCVAGMYEFKIRVMSGAMFGCGWAGAWVRRVPFSCGEASWECCSSLGGKKRQRLAPFFFKVSHVTYLDNVCQPIILVQTGIHPDP